MYVLNVHVVQSYAVVEGRSGLSWFFSPALSWGTFKICRSLLQWHLYSMHSPCASGDHCIMCPSSPSDVLAAALESRRWVAGSSWYLGCRDSGMLTVIAIFIWYPGGQEGGVEQMALPVPPGLDVVWTWILRITMISGVWLPARRSLGADQSVVNVWSSSPIRAFSVNIATWLALWLFSRYTGAVS